MKAIVKEILTRNNLLKSNDAPRFQYMMLGRLESDCDYFLGYGNRNKKHLWALDAAEQIKIMRALWLWLPVKPEWLTMEQINEYAKEMLN